jgi:hypothetical protein
MIASWFRAYELGIVVVSHFRLMAADAKADQIVTSK